MELLAERKESKAAKSFKLPRLNSMKAATWHPT
jgi:hypothetical protein